LSESKKRAWLDKWIRLQANHPQLEELENSVYNFCRDYARRPGDGLRMILYGGNGSGKSHAAKAVWRWAQRMAINLPLVDAEEGMRLANAEFWNWPWVVDELKKGSWHLIEDMIPCSLLVLDDIGAEHDPSKVGAEKLYLLLEHRQHKWTILTTNIGPDEWDEKFERRISSRFLRNSKHVSLLDVPDFNAR
jgi:DNA replication protein DnaC